MRYILIGILVILSSCSTLTPQEKWANLETQKCHAMGGNYFYDWEERTISCYRHPIGRMTKTLFVEKFKEE